MAVQHSEAFEKLVASIKPHITEISIAKVLEYKESKRDFVFIDVREDHEWVEGRAIGAIHLGRGIIERDIEKVVPSKDQEIVLYCGGGYRSALSADNLQKMGYTNVLSMAGGIRAWRERELPEDKG
ncbi:MAG: sulfurtransferase [Cyanobacteria bacterium REEB67]|nr:sulfurtransferase [Cyanobacteria bacterium REEB67]